MTRPTTPLLLSTFLPIFPSPSSVPVFYSDDDAFFFAVGFYVGVTAAIVVVIVIVVVAVVVDITSNKLSMNVGEPFLLGYQS